MDELTAYRILRLEPDSSLEEIRKAYAALSKEFHPEEQPEEFQKIHDAYRLLAAKCRRQRNEPKPVYSYEEQKESAASKQEDFQNADTADDVDGYEFEDVLRRAEEKIKEEQQEALEEERRRQEEIFRRQEVERRRQEEVRRHQEEKLDFDSTLEKEEKRQQEALLQLCRKALIEMELLFSPQYRNNLKMIRGFFEKQEYCQILKHPEFLKGFVKLLEQSNLKKEIYEYMIDFYRLRGADSENLLPEIADLYRVLNEKCGMKKKSVNWAYLIPIFLLIILKTVRNGLRRSGNQGTLGILLIIVILAYFFIWLHAKLRRKYSEIFAQFIVALLLTVSQFIMLGAEAYAPLIGVTGSDTLGFLLFAFGIVWMIVLAVMAIVKKIRNRVK